MKRAVSLVAKALDAEQCMVVLRDPDTGDFVPQWPAVGLTEKQIRWVRWPSAKGEEFLRQVPLDRALHLKPPPANQTLHLWGERELLVARLQHGEELYGGLQAANKRLGSFNTQDATFLAVAARMMAIVHAHARAAYQREAILLEQRLILDTVSDYVYAFRVEPDGRMIGEFVSPSFIRTFGYTLEEIRARGGWQSLVHPDDLETVLAHVARVLAKQPDVAEFRFTTRAGEHRWLRDYASPVWDEKAGRVVRIIGAAKDITEARQKELALRESETRYRTLVEQAPYAIGIHQDGRLVFVNQAAVELLGASDPAELIGQPIKRFVHPDEWEHTLERVRNVLAGDKAGYPVENRYIRLDGCEIPVEVMSSPLVYQGRPAVLVIARDLTEERRTRAQIERQREHLERLHRLSMALNATIDLNEVLARFADEVLRVSQVNRCSIWLKDPYHPLVHPHVFGENLPESQRQVDAIAVDANTIPLIAEALQRTQPLHVPDASAPEVADLVPKEFRRRYRVRSFLLIPLRVPDQSIGFLVMDDTRHRHIFSEDEIHTAESMAATAAIAIHNALLYQQAKRSAERWQALHQAAQQITRSARDLEAVYQAAHQAVTRMFPADAFVISLKDGDEVKGAYLWDNGQRWPAQRFPAGSGLSWRILHTGQPVLIEDRSPQDNIDAHHFGTEQAVRSLLAVPMRLGNRVIGMLSVQSYHPHVYHADDVPPLEMLAAHVAVAIETARLFAREQTQRELAESLAQTASALTATLDEKQVIAQVLNQVGRVLPHDAVNVMLVEGDKARVVQHQGYRELGLGDTMDQWSLQISTTPNLRTMVQTREPVIIPDTAADPNWIPPTKNYLLRAHAGAPLRTASGVIGFLNVDAIRAGAFSPEQAAVLQAFADQAAIAIQNARRYAETQRRVAELESVRRASLQLTRSLSLSQVLGTILEQAITLVDGGDAHIFLFDGERLTFGAAMWNGQLQDRPIAQPRPGGTTDRVARSGQPIIIHDVSQHELYRNYQGPAFKGALASLPLKIGERVVGVMNMSYGRPHHFDEHELRALQLLADQAAVAIENARLYTQAQERLQRVEALHYIDNLIAGAVDLRLTLTTLASYVCANLQVDAVDILLLNIHSRRLTCEALQGFRVTTPGHLSAWLGEGLVGSVAMGNRPRVVDNLETLQADPRCAMLVRNEKFAFYTAVPLIAKGEVKGVLEVFHRQPKEVNAEWLNFLETIAGQAAIAIEHSALFQELQRANQQLRFAYEATLEGWAHALEFRDQETEGHSRRVVDLTIKVAEAMGIPASEQVHIRRGALLHDIGKMGVPDRILLKPGPLTDEEWRIMRQHPVYAYELLSRIPYLRPALDIPHYHHERWDGSGYPEGLKGKEIPLAARIFAVVDVWDALNSNRPYRPAWPREKVIAYLQENAGKLFDPQVVKVFLQVIEEE